MRARLTASSVIGRHVKGTATVVEPGGVHEHLIKFAVGKGENGRGHDATAANGGG
jgi:hypothetical protein